MPQKKSVSVQLVGGLGNQLFCYAFGIYVQRKYGRLVNFDLSEVDRGYTRHGVSISSFDLPGKFLNYRTEFGALVYFYRRLSFALQARAPIPVTWPFSRSFTATEVGWSDENEIKATAGVTMRGYFASHRYRKWLDENGFGFDLSITNPSSYFENLDKELKGLRFLSIHIRRGDYVGQADAYGLCGPGYFSEAMRVILEGSVRIDKILVFSDDVPAAKAILGQAPVGLSEFLFVDPPPGSDAAESLALMTKASAHIISNSSFSLWGALVAKSSDLVIAPIPWHKGMEEPRDLVPVEWKRIPAHFA